MTDAPGCLTLNTRIDTPAQAAKWVAFIADWFDLPPVEHGLDTPEVKLEPAPKPCSLAADEPQPAAAPAVAPSITEPDPVAEQPAPVVTEPDPVVVLPLPVAELPPEVAQAPEPEPDDDGWTPERDLKLAEILVSGKGIGAACHWLGLPKGKVLARWNELLPVKGLTEQQKLLKRLRAEVAA